MSVEENEKKNFKTFVEKWNEQLNFSTPPVHCDMAQWLEEAWLAKDLKLLLMAFRSSGKSTIVGLFAAWLLYTNPDLRILVLAADYPLAKKMVRNVKRIIERHPMTQNMRPDRPEQWASDTFTIRREIVSRDPSMQARGVTSNITGSRADIVICDDVEVPNTCDSGEKREELRTRLAEISYILVPGGTQLYIGTPHSYYTIYAKEPRAEIGEEAPFLQGFNRKEIPVLDGEGKSAWEERFPAEYLDEMRRDTGPNKFASQMLLLPVNIAEGRLDPDLIEIYEGGLYYAKEIMQLHIDGKVMVSASSWWDPAFGSAKGDNSVLACVFSDKEGNMYLHHLEYITCDPHDDTDEATQQCRIVARIAKELMLPSIAIEINGLGRFLPSLLKNELAEARSMCAVKEISTRKPKEVRIIEAFDAPLAAKRFYMHRDVCKTNFMMEMREWRPGVSGIHDDGLDAVAGALSQEPVRLPRVFGAGGCRWTGASRPFAAKTDFTV